MGSFTGTQNSSVMEHIPFFHAASLSDTQEHTIVTTALTSNTWFLDSIVYETQNSAIAGGGGGGPVTGSSPSPAIVGGVVAAVVALLAIAGIIFVILRRRRLRVQEGANHQTVKEAWSGEMYWSSHSPFQILAHTRGKHFLSSIRTEMVPSQRRIQSAFLPGP